MKNESRQLEPDVMGLWLMNEYLDLFLLSIVEKGLAKILWNHTTVILIK